MACLLINSLLNTFDCVALFNLDPGKPLLTPPSLISLHLLASAIIGPTFCKLISPYHPNSHSIYLGHITPINCSLCYLDATNQLLNLYLSFQPSHQNSSSIHCKRYCRHLNQHNQTKKLNPPSINTLGQTKGIGRELLDQLIQSIQPTKIFSFSEDESSNPIHSNDLEISKTQPIGPTPLSSGLTPTDHCTLSLLSYLYSNPCPS
ncbi:hypothetical protein O181_040095 [Austropuccinia psidii MF-1]|uniref:Polynucleotide 5'-hydroxyl-kinase GRC3 n=1 Tax=Austropuccinia psidii MF-1 TaxID=1389203 RepID=A0A9Q3HFT0_9BASI|nr:hypothetical protein [Austropuccinia psidii MF-1]